MMSGRRVSVFKMSLEIHRRQREPDRTQLPSVLPNDKKNVRRRRRQQMAPPLRQSRWIGKTHTLARKMCFFFISIKHVSLLVHLDDNPLNVLTITNLGDATVANGGVEGYACLSFVRFRILDDKICGIDLDW